MTQRNAWTRNELLVAYALYCRLPFGRLHARNPEIIRYAQLLGRTPGSLAMKLTNIASLDPKIIESGRRGLSGASAADRQLWHEMQSDWTLFTERASLALEELSPPLPAATAAEERPDYVGEDVETRVHVRRRQGFFRATVLSAYQHRCCISGLAEPALLIASHIRPWALDEHNRLNPHNGLCLSALHDRAFDQGYLTIDESNRVVVSERLRRDDDGFAHQALLNFHGRPIQLAEKFPPSPEFLAFHRDQIFEQPHRWGISAEKTQR